MPTNSNIRCQPRGPRAPKGPKRPPGGALGPKKAQRALGPWAHGAHGPWAHVNVHYAPWALGPRPTCLCVETTHIGFCKFIN